jgi:hypothetical protein
VSDLLNQDIEGPAPADAATPHPELVSTRRDFERRVGDLRSAFDRDFGWAPRNARWVLPTVAAAAGFGAAMWLRALAGGDGRRVRREHKA